MTKYTYTLKQTDIFYKLTSIQLDLIADYCQEKIFNAGEIIFAEGANSNELYIIAQGEVEILVNPALVSDRPSAKYPPVIIEVFRRGQSFGEMALVDSGLRSATARAAGDNTHLLLIKRDHLIALCENYPTLGYQLMYNLATDLALKLRSTGLRIRSESLTESGSDQVD
jgi:CRP/FNR family transcriptional regulator, cyclic AMP receptor protein